LKQTRFIILIALFPSTFPFSVDIAISQVGPKEAAQTRQAEIARQMFCNEKAAREKLRLLWSAAWTRSRRQRNAQEAPSDKRGNTSDKRGNNWLPYHRGLVELG
jgi:hypothetical protein